MQIWRIFATTFSTVVKAYDNGASLFSVFTTLRPCRD